MPLQYIVGNTNYNYLTLRYMMNSFFLFYIKNLYSIKNINIISILINFIVDDLFFSIIKN